MNATLNGQLVRAFQAARHRLSPARGGTREFICCCIDCACEDGEISEPVADAAKRVIESRLGGCHTLEGWLHKRGGVPEWDVWNDRYNNEGRKTQATRKAWLESLIKEFGGAAP